MGAIKYPVNACGMRDSLSGDTLASRWHNLVPLVLAKLLSGLVNCRLKFWYIEEIGNILTVSSIVSSAVCG